MLPSPRAGSSTDACAPKFPRCKEAKRKGPLAPTPKYIPVEGKCAFAVILPEAEQGGSRGHLVFLWRLWHIFFWGASGDGGKSPAPSSYIFGYIYVFGPSSRSRAEILPARLRGDEDGQQVARQDRFSMRVLHLGAVQHAGTRASLLAGSILINVLIGN